MSNNGDVLGVSGSLQCYFPAHAVNAPSKIIQDPELVQWIAQLLCRFSSEALESATEKSKKASNEMKEL